MKSLYLLITFILSISFGYPYPALAGNPLCDKAFDGVTVQMTLDQARAIWLSKGYIEITNPRESNQTLLVENLTRNSSNDKNQDYISLKFTNYIDQISITRQFDSDDTTNITKARIAEFCPNGPISGKKLHCLIPKTGSSIQIEVNPESPEVSGRCSYNYGTHRGRLATEKITLHLRPANKTSTNKLNMPALKKGPELQHKRGS